MATPEDIAWAAGFFEGEGCIAIIGSQFGITLTNTDKWTIDRFDDLMPVGKIYGPYDNRQADGYRRKPFWRWVAHREAAMDGVQLLSPWLSPRRLARAHELTGVRFPAESLPI
jgi:hypothetical protein